MADANPYTSMLANDTTAGVGATAAANNAVTSMQSQVSSPYPTYSNSYGIGDSSASATPAVAPTSTTNPNLTQDVADTTSRGFNPWSLSGEANARGK